MKRRDNGIERQNNWQHLRCGAGDKCSKSVEQKEKPMRS